MPTPKTRKRNAPDLTKRNEKHLEKLIDEKLSVDQQLIAVVNRKVDALEQRVVALEGKVEILQTAIDAALAMWREGQNAKTPHAKAVQQLVEDSQK